MEQRKQERRSGEVFPQHAIPRLVFEPARTSCRGLASRTERAASFEFTREVMQRFIRKSLIVPGFALGAAVTRGAAPWSARSGHANVNLETGEIEFVVHGLVLAGGNSIGTPGAIVQVKGTLVCDTDGSAFRQNSVLVDTPLVDLDDQGDARFDGSVGALPPACTSEPDIAFVIRVSAGRWIANGTVLQ